MSAVYPETKLVDDEIDDPYGGAPADRFGTPARSFIDAVLQVLERAYIDIVRKPYTTHVVTLSGGGHVGTLLGFDTVGTVGGGAPYVVKKLSTLIDAGHGGDSVPIGFLLEESAPGVGNEKVRVAVGGIIPPTVTGLGTNVEGEYSIDMATGLIHANPGGEITILWVDKYGNGYLLFPGWTGG